MFEFCLSKILYCWLVHVKYTVRTTSIQKFEILLFWYRYNYGSLKKMINGVCNLLGEKKQTKSYRRIDNWWYPRTKMVYHDFRKQINFNHTICRLTFHLKYVWRSVSLFSIHFFYGFQKKMVKWKCSFLILLVK